MKIARAVYPNGGVQASYRKALRALVREMAGELAQAVRAAYVKEPPAHGFGTDVAPQAAGVLFRYTGFTDGARVLLLHRTDGLGWALPGGGIEPGEDAEQAARREVFEETGHRCDESLRLCDVQTGRVCYVTFVALAEQFCPVFNSEHDKFLWVTLQEALQLDLHPGVRAMLVRSEMGTAHDAKPRQPNLQRAFERWGGVWGKRLDNLSVKMAWNFAAKNREATDAAVKRSFHDAGLTVKFKPTRGMRSAFDAVVAENVALIKSIPQRLLTDIQSTVYANVLKGSDLKTLMADVQAKYAIADRRAALIARDQNAKAKAVFENRRRKEMGITEAIWQHSSAGVEPRPTHVKMNGKRYRLDEGMYDSHEGERIWPGQLINCRCTSRAVIEGFE